MAVLSDADRALIRNQFMREMSALLKPLPGLKADYATAAANIDDILDGNTLKTAVNNAFPVAIRSVLTADQKAAFFTLVVMKRQATGA
jgi:hypothetical protein